MLKNVKISIFDIVITILNMGGEIIRRPSKTIKLDVDEKWIVSYGTFNKKNPKTVHVIMQTWLKPLKNDFIEILCDIENHIKRYKVGFNNIFQERTITWYDIAKSKMKIEKSSLLKIKIHLLQKDLKPFLEAREDVINIVRNLIDKIEKIGEGVFLFSRKK